ncbi:MULTISPECIES: hypothetical protein [Mycobacterium]|uniref:Uncharacterized protein n=1 Tax=Mycobacterium kiyosense TaxID=2871094 RepID=A0A9P3UXX2_9MYCO|nr:MULTISPECIES: hypothetical protein [Mycobacterium]BDB43098.1 hypothetical protein IWGMT90018_35440 [Mycobacterium kiyosense]BDE13693.1 hypothetical protein MKCMC460_25530 [Mycobacterium sp. 20KCMC460]GLB84480.1 hypothetical protein SRL2020028_37360 [Mycobacterium kiyosense]GLB89063.1 hypothetical protein SRL2020130_18800 [Mycobacterium kiyosense]GLB94333.1 hypothetical protein SRL2020226_11090 [Mycobacterium kiyosense]
MIAATPPSYPRLRATSHRAVRAHEGRHSDENLHIPPHFTAPKPAPPAEPRYLPEPPTGDRRQAEYFLALLTANLRRIDHRIEKCRAGITFAQAAGDIDNVLGFRDLFRVELRERQTVEALIAKLRRRFSLPGGDQVR